MAKLMKFLKKNEWTCKIITCYRKESDEDGIPVLKVITLSESADVLSYLTEEREAAIQDFHTTDNIDNQTKLARLAGEIAALDRLLRVFTDDQ